MFDEGSDVFRRNRWQVADQHQGRARFLLADYFEAVVDAVGERARTGWVQDGDRSCPRCGVDHGWGVGHDETAAESGRCPKHGKHVFEHRSRQSCTLLRRQDRRQSRFG
jgi:hypothetical protein